MVDFTQKAQYTVEDLRRIVALLRAPGGCPWDGAQTHESIRRNFIEEAYEVAEAIDAVVAQVPADNPPTALVLTTFSGGTRVQSSGTQTGAMLADLGVNNLADENRSLLKDFSLEAVIEMDPDFIFVIPMGNDTEAAMRNLEEATAANPAWASLSAVQNGRYITLDPTLYLAKPNAQWDAAYQGLFDNLYGQN